MKLVRLWAMRTGRLYSQECSWYSFSLVVPSSKESSGSHKGLSPCDFDLIPKMKEPLRGIRFRTVPEILQAVNQCKRRSWALMLSKKKTRPGGLARGSSVFAHIAKLQYPLTDADSQHYEVALYKWYQSLKRSIAGQYPGVEKCLARSAP